MNKSAPRIPSAVHAGLLAAMLAASLAACGGGADEPPPAPPVSVAPPAPQAESPYGGTGVTPPGPEAEGISLVVGRLRGIEQGRGILDGSIKYQDGVLGAGFGELGVLPDGTLLSRGTPPLNTALKATLYRVELNGNISSMPGPWDQERTCPGLLGCFDSDISSMAIGPGGRIYINSTATGLLYILDASGLVLSSAPFEKHVTPFTVDGAGNLYYIANGGALKQRAPDGTLTTLATGSTTQRLGLLIGDPRSSGLYMAVTDGNFGGGTAIERYVPGTGFVPFVGNRTLSAHVDGSGSNARFVTIVSATTDRLGNLYVGDASRTLRKVTPQGAVTTLAGNAVAGFSQPQWGPLLDRAIPATSLAVLPQGIAVTQGSELRPGILLVKVPVTF